MDGIWFEAQNNGVELASLLLNLNDMPIKNKKKVWLPKFRIWVGNWGNHYYRSNIYMAKCNFVEKLA